MYCVRYECNLRIRHVDLFTEEHIASNIFIFYLAGHETTALTISFALYELALQPEIQDKLRGEIKKAREANNGVMDYKTIKNIAYLEMVVSGGCHYYVTDKIVFEGILSYYRNNISFSRNFTITWTNFLQQQGMHRNIQSARFIFDSKTW